MHRLNNILKAPAVLAVLLLCSALAAQDLKVAVREPAGDVDRGLLEIVSSQLTAAISSARGFQLFDRANIEQVVGEHAFQSDEFLVSAREREGRELGQFKGADLVVTTKLSMYGGDLHISCQAQDIVSNEVVGSETRLVEGVSARTVGEASRSLMEELLKNLNGKLSGGLRRGEPLSPLAGLQGEIKAILVDNRSVPKWNKVKETAVLEIDLASVSLAENRQHGAPMFRVTGSVRFVLDGAGAALELEPFTEISRELIRQKIKAQVQARVNGVIRDLLSQLD
jgi:hypothetical protein